MPSPAAPAAAPPRALSDVLAERRAQATAYSEAEVLTEARAVLERPEFRAVIADLRALHDLLPGDGRLRMHLAQLVVGISGTPGMIGKRLAELPEPEA